MLRFWTALALTLIVHGFLNLAPSSVMISPASQTSFHAHTSSSRAYTDQNTNSDSDDDDYSDNDSGDYFKLTDHPAMPLPPIFETQVGVVRYLPLTTQTHQEPEIQPPKIQA